MQELSFEEASAAFRVENGKLIWQIARGRMKPGAIAGRLNPDGYVVVMYKGRAMLAHRLIWLVTYGTWPQDRIDHVNGVHDDNRIENLRVATHSQNIANSKVRRDNAGGVKGATRLPSGKWQAQIKANKVYRYLGTFENKDDAKAAYERAAKEAFGEFAFSERAA